VGGEGWDGFDVLIGLGEEWLLRTVRMLYGVMWWFMVEVFGYIVVRVVKRGLLGSGGGCRIAGCWDLYLMSAVGVRAPRSFAGDAATWAGAFAIFVFFCGGRVASEEPLGREASSNSWPRWGAPGCPTSIGAVFGAVGRTGGLNSSTRVSRTWGNLREKVVRRGRREVGGERWNNSTVTDPPKQPH